MKKTVPSAKLSAMTVTVDGVTFVPSSIEVAREGDDTLFATVKGSGADNGDASTLETEVVLNQNVIAEISKTMLAMKADKATSDVATATGVAIGAAVHIGTNMVKDFIHGKGRGKHGPRATPEAQPAEGGDDPVASADDNPEPVPQKEREAA
jgi:hypothetical protein